MTSLMLACERKNAAAAAELMEATKNAGALDLQVNVVWSVWCEGCGQVVGAGREEGGGGHLRRALTYACMRLYRIACSARRCIMQAGAGWRAR
jgi:hypothetical protein